MKKMWEIKQLVESPDRLQLYIYGDVVGDSYDWWTDMVVESETSANHFRNELAKYSDVKNIDLFINSNGGSVFEGTAIYNQLKRHTAYKTAYIDGFACSIASVIAMSADKIVMPKNTTMMIHNAWTYACGNAEELRKMADDLEQISKASRQAYLEKAKEKLSEEKLIEMLNKETWLTAEECISYGLADEYSQQEANLEEAKNLLEKSNLSLEQRIRTQQSLRNQLNQLFKVDEKKPINQLLEQEHEQKENLLFLFSKI